MTMLQAAGALPSRREQEEDARKAPDALKSIGEVADELDVPAHVLRFWETKFPSLMPVKCRGGRRYYRPGDVRLLARVKELLYREGFTIKGARQYLARNRKEAMVETAIIEEGQPPEMEAAMESPAMPESASSTQMDFFSRPILSPRQKTELRGLLHELAGLQDMLKPYVY